MLKIMIVSFYDLIEYFAAIKKGFIEIGYEVVNYPLFRYAYDQYDKKKDYLSHFIENIEENSPNVILWCFFDIPSGEIVKIKNKFKHITFILFNFDEPMNISTDLFKKSETCEIVVTTSKEYHDDYKKHANVKHILYNPFGCDNDFFYKIDKISNINISDNEFVCDIGIVCYNLLYDTNYFSAQTINRKEMISNICMYCKNKNKIFKLFGNPSLKEFFPDNYIGEITYINKNKLYNNAKIIINTQSFNNKSFYFDENLLTILGSGALVLTDKSKDIDNIFINKKDLIYLDKNFYIRQIDDILTNYNKYEYIRENAIEIAQKYSWKNWCKKVNLLIVKHLFNPAIYSEIYNIDIDDATYDKWLKYGSENNHIAIKFNVPNNFNQEGYVKKYNLVDKSKDYLYYHWYHFDKSDLFFGIENKNSMFDPTKFNMSMEKFILLSSYFNESTHDLDNSLYKISEISRMHPECDINKLLEIYYQLVQ